MKVAVGFMEVSAPPNGKLVVAPAAALKYQQSLLVTVRTLSSAGNYSVASETQLQYTGHLPESMREKEEPQGNPST